MHDDSKLILARIDRLMSQRIAPAKYRAKAPVELTKWAAPGEPVPFIEAVAQPFSPISVGESWGRPWGTTWFHVRGTVPREWESMIGEDTLLELVTDIGFNDTQSGFQCEAMAYTVNGRIIKAVEPHNRYVTLPQTGEGIELYLEAASNPDVINEWTYVPTEMGRWQEDNKAHLYHLTEICLGLRDLEVCALYADLETLRGLVEVLPERSPRRGLILGAFAEVLRVVDPEEVSRTATAGRESLAPALAKPATASSHKVLAVGHAHIDSAWLWPVRETARKVARTFSNVLDLMDKHPDFIFAASSAQQYEWIKDQYPELFERVKAQVAAGRFVPVGGMWVECDTNLPGGEALARQFIAGGAFFREEFGIEAPEAWLPDSFGYTAALPQIIKLAGAKWFLTQKISWNQVNRMPHHTFWWEGIDGTRVFSHFPPVDTYMSDLSAEDLKRAEEQYAEKSIEGTSLVPYGYGDGGGGPTREMMDLADRKRDLEGSPRVKLGTPQEFFADANRQYPDAPVWSGELYLELHRGTFTSQARTKRGNRHSESLLRQAELWAATAAVRTGLAYPSAELEAVWKVVLRNQFHDILPGTSIGWVHDQVEAEHRAAAQKLEAIIQRSLEALSGQEVTIGSSLPTESAPTPGSASELIVNAGPFPYMGVAPLSAGRPVALAAEDDQKPLTVSESADGIRVRTKELEVVVASDGTISSLYDVEADREAVAPGLALNKLQLFRDTPSEWDAWDIDLIDRVTKKELVRADRVEVTEVGDDHVVIVVERAFNNSSVIQSIRIGASGRHLDIRTEVDWHEKEKMLKLAFPFDVRAQQSTSETQFGHLHRPLHTNTSWDVARFETPAHRWVHVGEPNYGFAVANDSVYGYDFSRDTREDGGTTTQVRLSLLRAPLYPDPQSDQGRHTFNVRVHAGAEISDAIRDGYELNVPGRPMSAMGEGGLGEIAPLISVTDSSAVVESVKLAEDGSGDVIVRLYESQGMRTSATITADFAVTQIAEVNLHERALAQCEALVEAAEGAAHVGLRPFQIVTLRFSR